MKINAISTTNFKGLFTDKTAQNNGNWLMEYSPYSWEKNNTSKMAIKEKIDVFSDHLPDNEEIYTKFSEDSENSKDIFGTESYYKHSDGKMRTVITEVPAMNREESLKVQNRKLDVFLEMKNNKYQSIKSGLNNTISDVYESGSIYKRYADDIPLGFFSSQYDRVEAVNAMNNEFDKVSAAAIKTYQDFQRYDQLRESADAVYKTQAKNTKEISLLQNLRKSGALIDISRRDLRNPDLALDELFNHSLETIKTKFVCLPHKLISIGEIMKMMGRAAELPTNKAFILSYIKGLI